MIPHMKEIPSEVLFTKGNQESKAYDWVQGINHASKDADQKIKITKAVRWARDVEPPAKQQETNRYPSQQASQISNTLYTEDLQHGRDHAYLGDESNIG